MCEETIPLGALKTGVMYVAPAESISNTRRLEEVEVVLAVENELLLPWAAAAVLLLLLAY